MDKMKEIAAILSGRIAFYQGAYVAANRLLDVNFQGVNSGSFAVNVLGVSHLIRHYEAKNPEQAANQALRIFAELGRPVLFREEPEEKACLVRPVFGNPSIMTLEKTDSGLLLNVYTARTLLCSVSRRRAIAAFERRLPEELQNRMEATNEKEPRPPREGRKARKARKKAERWAKKVEKAEKRSEKIKAQAQNAQESADKQGGENASE